MSTKSPIFPMPEPHHFSDYGFDPQIDFFQVLGEARRQKREASRSIDSIHFKLQKPISKDDSKRAGHKSSKKKKWWRNALLFFKWSRWTPHPQPQTQFSARSASDVTHHRAAGAFRASISGPLYLTESRSGSSTPYRTTSRPSSGPIAGTLTPARKGEAEIPYFSMREMNMEPRHHHQSQRVSTSALPIYLVT